MADPLRCVQEVKEGLPSVAALASELPALVATLHGSLRQLVHDLETLTKTHPACADAAPLCSQVSTLLVALWPVSQPSRILCFDRKRFKGATATGGKT